MSFVSDIGPALEKLVKNAVPCVQIFPYQKAIHWRLGRVVRILDKPGLYFHIPGPVDTIERVSANDLPLQMRNVVLQTRDQIQVSINGNMVYAIDDVLKYVQNGDAIETNITGMAERLARQAFASRKLDELDATSHAEGTDSVVHELRRYGASFHEEYQELPESRLLVSAQEEVLASLQGYAEYYGVRMKQFNIGSIAKSRPLRIQSDQLPVFIKQS